MLLFIVLVQILCVCSSYDGPEAKTELGVVRGEWKTSSEGNDYSSFEGIPYATPPVGNLRFEEPQPIKPWDGVLEATKLYECYQTPIADMYDVGETVGSEDCLYLNIYVPGKEINENNNFNVIFHIHGGAFMLGSGHMMINSSLVMNQNEIIYVSINYRLGAFGFLSTEDDVIPGNNGMKDQVLALKWVKDNIERFGGNPNSVAITGFSAGGASVHLHYLSPLSKGLFNRGVSHSGCALNPWVIKENPLLFAKNLSVSTGCPDSPSEELKKCLKTVPGPILIKKSRDFIEYGQMPFSPFAVVVDGYSKNPFLPENPYQLLKKKRVADVPWIASVSNDEGVLPAAYYCNSLDTIERDFIDKAHILLDFNHTLPVEKRKQFAMKIKNHYLGEENISEENYQKLIKIFTHRLFFDGVEEAIKLQSKANKSPVYYYLFNYGESIFKMAYFLCPDKAIKGVGHCDDAFFVYGFNTGNKLSENDEQISKVFKKIIKFFINDQFDLLDKEFNWLPNDGNLITYLNITSSNDIHLQSTKSMVPEDVWNELNAIEYQLRTKDEL